MKQLELIRKTSKSYGGELLNKRRGRSHGRPLITRGTMHLVLRSTQAKGEWSFRLPSNRGKIEKILTRFAAKNGIRILSLANVGNHLHLHLKLSTLHTYRRFIRATTGAIAMAVTGASRKKSLTKRFWDRRPFSRVLKSWKPFLILRDYIEVNQLEGLGISREEARQRLAWRRAGSA